MDLYHVHGIPNSDPWRDCFPSGWSLKMLEIGLGWPEVVFAYFALDDAWDLFGALHRLWLPSAELLRFPEAGPDQQDTTPPLKNFT